MISKWSNILKFSMGDLNSLLSPEKISHDFLPQISADISIHLKAYQQHFFVDNSSQKSSNDLNLVADFSKYGIWRFTFQLLLNKLFAEISTTDLTISENVLAYTEKFIVNWNWLEIYSTCWSQWNPCQKYRWK